MSREHAVTPHPMSLSPETAAPFPPTRWSLVVSSHGQEESALGELCRLYWQPLYSFCRRSGLGIEDAEDVTQHFFHDLLKNRAGLLEGADPAGGRLRSLFLRVLQRRIVDHHRHATRVIRGGGKRSRWTPKPPKPASRLLPPRPPPSRSSTANGR